MGGGRGCLIAFEGADGVGKTTQVSRLADWLQQKGRSAKVVREPGGTPVGEAIRHVLLRPEHVMAPLTETLLFVAARHEVVERVLRPALAQGSVVLADRFTLSTVAYQHFGAGVPREQVEALNQWATGGLTPDLTILLIAEQARRLNQDRMEQRADSFHDRVREGYLTLSREHWEHTGPEGRCRLVVLAREGDADHVAAAVLDAVRPLLDGEGGRRA